MNSEYQLHLSFLGIGESFPAYKIFRRVRLDLTEDRPDGTWGYTLPKVDSYPEDRDHYWISMVEIEGFEPFNVVDPRFNNALSSNVLLESLAETCGRYLKAEEFWVQRKGFLKEVHLNMRVHPEGTEQLVLQPYFLRQVSRFGFLADFHFRMNEEVPFSRKIQQLSLSLDRHGRRNLNFYAERAAKVEHFLEEREEILGDILLPGSTAALSLSTHLQALPAGRLRSRTYIMGNGRESKGQYVGLRDHGPLENVQQIPTLVFVFRESERIPARELATALRGDNPRTRGSFPGFQRVFRTAINISREPIILDDFSMEAMTKALEDIRGREGLNVPILVMPHDEKAYLNHKAVFTNGAVPSQVCTLEMLRDETTFKWSVGNVALQIFCKASGQPWKVRPTDENSLIIGISQSHKVKREGTQTSVEKYFAFSVLTDSSGLFQKIQILSQADQESDYLSQLESSLETALKEASEQYRRVVIHTSFKLKQREIARIQKVVQSLSSDRANACKFAVVKVNHKNRFFAYNRNANSLVPYEGSFVRLGIGEYLVWFEGVFPDKQTVNKVFPGPTHLQIMRCEGDESSDDHILLQDLVNLSGANWRGFNAKSAPVSVFYCHLVADLVHDFQEMGLPMPAVQDLRPWFL